MRKELEIIQLIEKYLNNELSSQDKTAFEEKLKNNPQLQEEVEKQRLVQEGVKNVALKGSIKKAWKSYRLGKFGTLGGIVGLTFIAALTATMWFANQTPEQYSENIKYAQNENGEEIWADADELVPAQFFTVNAGQDNVLETEGGLVVAVPKGSLLQNGKPVTGDIEIEIKEALTPEDILLSGLSTKSGDQLLETGGMFYFNARKNGENLTIDKNNGIAVDVPTDDYKAGMELYDGLRKEDGSIDWQNPKPIETFLTTVDITSLDFYPPQYENKLADLGEGNQNKNWKDSLYYSFASDSSYFVNVSYATSEIKFIEKRMKQMGVANTYKYDERWYTRDTIWHDLSYQINPAKVKTIWDKKFNNTLLATKEFEERLSYIFQTCDDEILDLYVNNLDKRMSTIDSMVVERLCGNRHAPAPVLPPNSYSVQSLLLSQITQQMADSLRSDSLAQIEALMEAAAVELEPNLCSIFRNFSLQNKGRVKDGDKAAKILSEHYAKQSKAYAQAFAKTQRDYWKKYEKLNQDLGKMNAEQQQKEVERNWDNYIKEYDINIKEACRQLGIKKDGKISENQYRVIINNPGWKNVDRAVNESLLSRTTLNYKHSNGKTAIIKYEPCEVKVTNGTDFERVMVYLMPRELNSFMRMPESANGFKENLNELIQYQLVAVGINGDDIYYAKLDEALPKSYALTLAKTTKKELRKLLRKGNVKSVRNDVLDDVKYQLTSMQMNKEKTKFEDMAQFRNEIIRAIFPCALLEGATKVE